MLRCTSPLFSRNSDMALLQLALKRCFSERKFYVTIDRQLPRWNTQMEQTQSPNDLNEA